MPPQIRDQGNADGGQLRLLAILHFAAGAVSFAGIGLLVWHYGRIHGAFLDLVSWKRQTGGEASLEPFFGEFRRFHLITGAVAAAYGTGNLLSGLLIVRRQGRLLSLAVACMNCLLVPIGTLLGAFAMVVLLRDSAREAYEARAAGRAPAGGAI